MSRHVWVVERKLNGGKEWQVYDYASLDTKKEASLMCGWYRSNSTGFSFRPMKYVPEKVDE